VSRDNGAAKAVIVGPAAPAEMLDRLDAEQAEKHARWSSMRTAVVSVGKRMGLLTESAKKDASKQVRTRLTKAGELQAPTTHEDDDDLLQYGRTDMVDDTLMSPYDFEVLCSLEENSGSLRQNIDAMATNVDGFGHRFEPVIDFTSPEADNLIRDVMLVESLEKGMPDDLMELDQATIDDNTPSIDEVQARKILWERIATIEKAKIEPFFEFINPVNTFVELRTAMRRSRELLGNAGWEVIREDPADVESKISQVYGVPFVHVRLVRADRKPIEASMVIRKNLVHFETIKVNRFFRRFMRMTGSTRIYYKEFGDPRVVSRDTGRYYESVKELQSDANEGEKAKPANEFFHWEIPSEVSAYGIPRWIGALLAVIGSRAAEEVNFLYFDNKAIPAMVMLVSGGRVSEESVTKIESYIEDHIKGRANYHKIMILEALPAGVDASEGDLEHSGKTRIELKPLLGNQIQDALFQEYDANNTTKIGRSFRQPPILTGDTKDMNRSTAETAKALAEEQIYQPVRDQFDKVMDRHFLTNLKVHFWRFVTNAPVQRLPNDLVDNVKKSLEAGAIVPNEARVLLGDAFSTDLDYKDEDWAKIPPKLAVAAARQGALPGAEPGDEGSRAADEVESAVGDLVGRGKTSESEGHLHGFAAVREGAQIRVMVMPGGEDGHSHSVAPVPFKDGGKFEITTAPHGGEGGHAHEVAFTAPMSKRRQRAHNAAVALAYLRRSIQEEVEAGKDEFFDASKLEQPEDD